MPQIQLDSVTIGFRGPPLLDEVNCVIEPGDKIGLLGRNGEGKTTLMRLLSGQLSADHGRVVLAPGTNVSQLRQDVPHDIEASVAEVVRTGAMEGTHEEHWEADHAVEKTLTRMGLDGEARFESLSSGMKRRVLLAQAIVGEPDVLLLDEPTNHLDIDAINWLEQFLLGWRGTLLFVTHDRVFLRRLATRILEIDRGRLFDWSCDYDTFLLRKEQALAAEEKQNALFDKRLAEEEKWIRQGIKARRTRNEGRVRALKTMRNERGERRERLGTSKLQIQEASRSGALVADAEEVGFAYGDHTIFEDFSTTIMRGDKMGVIGPNGAGKTTLLRVLLGELAPTTGKVRLGTNLQIAYFDQLRDQLDPEKTVQENVGDGYDSINVTCPTANNRAAHHRLPARLPVHARPGADAGQASFRRRAQPGAAGQTVRQAGQRDRAGRTDQRSRRRDARTAGRAAGRIRRHAAAGQPRPGVPEQRGDQHDRLRAGAACGSTSAATTTGSANASSRGSPSRPARPPPRARKPKPPFTRQGPQNHLSKN